MNLSNENNTIEFEENIIPPRSQKTEGKTRSPIKWLILLISCVALFLGFFSLRYTYSIMTNGEKEIYFKDAFTFDLAQWQGDDMKWEEGFEGKKGLLSLKKNDFMLPYSMATISNDILPKDTFVFHYSFNHSEFTGKATTLSTLVFPTTSLSVVLNDEGKIGLARDLFAKPTFNKNIISSVKENTWNDVYVLVDGKEDRVQIYHNGTRVINESWEDPTYPLQEVWLGSIWLEGAGNYGSANQMSFDQIVLGNKAVLPKPRLIESIMTSSQDFISIMGGIIGSIVDREGRTQ